MTVDLRSLLAAPELGLSLCCGESQLDREVRWVVTTDLADPRRYMSGGELVLTGMMWRHDESDAEPFVSRLVTAGAVAIAAGDPDHDDLPADLLAACQRHGMPLFHVPPDVAFGTITEYAVRRLSAGRSADIAAVLGRHRSMFERNRGVGGVLGLVADEAGMSCATVSSTGRLVDGADLLGEEELRTLVVQAASPGPLPARVETKSGLVCSVFGIGAPLDAGRLLVVGEDHTTWPPERRDVVDELAAIVALDVEASLEGTRTDADLFQLLDDGTEPGVAAARLQLGHLAEDTPLAVVHGVAGEPELLPTVLAEVLGPVASAYLWAPHTDGVTAVAQLAAEPAELLANARAVAAATARRLPAGQRLTVGVSKPVTTFDGLGGALTEARQAQQVAHLKPDAAAVGWWDELKTHVLLLASVPHDVRQAFGTRVLGPLHGYDRQHSSHLVHTLAVFLACGCSWARAAAELHVHVNTLRYRIERIEQLTGKDLRQLPDQVDFYLALHLARRG